MANSELYDKIEEYYQKFEGLFLELERDPKMVCLYIDLNDKTILLRRGIDDFGNEVGFEDSKEYVRIEMDRDAKDIMRRNALLSAFFSVKKLPYHNVVSVLEGKEYVLRDDSFVERKTGEKLECLNFEPR